LSDSGQADDLIVLISFVELRPPLDHALHAYAHCFGREGFDRGVLTKLVNLWPASRIDELMPWAWAAEHSTNKLAA
jgi:hypothetical protein